MIIRHVTAWLVEKASFISALMVIIVSGMLCYEVIARFVFNSPTIWAQDYSVLAQVWFTYLAMGYALRRGDMIRITIVLDAVRPSLREVMNRLSSFVIVIVCVFICVLQFDVLMESIATGRKQPTMLALPLYLVEIPVLLGFFILGLQAMVQTIWPEDAQTPVLEPTTVGH
jgi:TRAP-type C4-dicarboxylate transport system permease small subunit